MEIKQGVFTEIIFHNDENGYTIAEMETDDELLTVVGNLPSAVKGACYELTGTFKVHPRYGEQFAFTEAMEKMPTTRIGIEGFLASGVIKGIGPKTATAIVNIFGEDTLRVIDEEPEKLSRVPGIGRKKADAIGESFAEHREFADVSLFFRATTWYCPARAGMSSSRMIFCASAKTRFSPRSTSLRDASSGTARRPATGELGSLAITATICWPRSS